MLLVLLGAILLFGGVGVQGKSTGAPQAACGDMNPQHGGNTPQSSPAPYEIVLSKLNYTAGEKLTVTLRTKSSSSEKFKGFLVQARRWDGNSLDPIGQFTVMSGTVDRCAGSFGNALTHSNPGEKDSITLEWTAPNPSRGHLQFRATFAQSFDKFWVGEKSAFVMDPTAAPMPSSTVGPTQGPIAAIDTSTCGKDKGCYREPAGCSTEMCQYVVTWKEVNEYIQFEMSSLTSGYIAAGFSHDYKMGNDAVTECTYVRERSEAVVRLSYNVDDSKANQLVVGVPTNTLIAEEAYFSNGMVQCRFRQKKLVYHSQGQIFNFTQQYYLFMARGNATKQGAKLRHSIEPHKDPFISPQMVSFTGKDNLHGRLKYPLVKAHGCLMLLAWMFSASLGIILARFYKPMWPNDKLCGEKIWFAIHRSCMVTACVCTIIAFILIFIFAGGYSQLPGWPYSHYVHPILGIIVTVLVIINPILALFRCHPKDDYRPIFNWVHWFVGTVAYTLAIPTLLIGLSLAKAGVPWWATWIMVAFMLFHVIVEVMLEVHNCLMARRNKDKKEQFEMQKKNDPRLADVEPEPVGRRFKNVMLGIYLIVAVILTIVMIFVVAFA